MSILLAQHQWMTHYRVPLLSSFDFWSDQLKSRNQFKVGKNLQVTARDHIDEHQRQQTENIILKFSSQMNVIKNLNFILKNKNIKGFCSPNLLLQRSKFPGKTTQNFHTSVQV